MKIFNASIIVLLVVVSMLLTGCASEKNTADSRETIVPEINATQAPVETEAEAESCSALFETVFVPTAEGRIGTGLEEFKAAATEAGFSCFEEAGVVMALDREKPEEYIRGEPTCQDGHFEIAKLVYGIEKGEAYRNVQVKLDTDEPEYYTGTTLYQEGTRVDSLGQIREYLTAEELPGDNTAELKANAGANLALFEDIFLQIADGSRGNDWENLQSILTEHGYLYYESEGQFSVEDPENPGSYLYGTLTTTNDYWEFAELGYRLVLPEEVRTVEVAYYTNGRWDPQYYVAATFPENGTPVESLEEMRDYIQNG